MPEVPGRSNTLTVNPLSGTDPTSAGVTGQSNAGPGVLGCSLGLDPMVSPPGPTGTGGRIISQGAPASDGVLGIGANGVHG
jgi:hypothetical protein